ncbi:MAG: nitroreductase/quinone reductase family protein [Myxococcota bacterium]
MKLSQVAVRFAVTPFGAALDRFCVRWLGHSPVSVIFARSEGVDYNPPLLLTTTGRKSRRQRTVVLPYFAAGKGRIAIVGSRGGMPTDPHWALNLRADPNATVFVRRRSVAVEATIASGSERELLWGSITTRSPVYLNYQKRAAGHREIPVFVLSARDGSSLR